MPSREDGAIQASINEAARAPLTKLRDKVLVVASYISAVAAEHYGGDITQVRCPDERTWSELSAGRQPILPSLGQLSLYANNSMRTLEGKYGSLREAYFVVALQLLQQEA